MRLSKTKRGSPGFRFASLDRERINPVTRAFLKPRRTRLDRFFGEFPFEIATDRSPESDPRSKLSFRRRANPGPSVFFEDFSESQTGRKLARSAGRNDKVFEPAENDGLQTVVGSPFIFGLSRGSRFLHEFRLSAAIAPGAHSFPHEHIYNNGRSFRCRPRPQQGPRGLHRQGRQHQLHDGVAAPRQQVSTGFEPRPRFRVFSRFSRRSRRAIVERATRTRAIVPAKTLEPRRFEWTCARARRPFIALHARLLCRPRTKG